VATHICFVKRTDMWLTISMQAITWKEFFTLMGLGLLCYYGWLLVRYFPGGIRANLVAGGRAKGKGLVFKGSGPEEEQENEQVVDEEQAEGTQLELPLPAPLPERREKGLKEWAEELSREINALVENAGKEKMPEGEVRYALQRLLDKEHFRPLKGSLFEETINSIIRVGLADHCSIHLDATELKGLWIR
jgi:hypothetical protein